MADNGKSLKCIAISVGGILATSYPVNKWYHIIGTILTYCSKIVQCTDGTIYNCNGECMF